MDSGGYCYGSNHRFDQQIAIKYNTQIVINHPIKKDLNTSERILIF